MAVKKPGDLKVKASKGFMEFKGPSGKPIHVRVHEKSRERESECRDRVELEIQYKQADKKKWIKVAYLLGRDSYEDESRYVLEDNEVKDAELAKILKLLGSKTPAKQFVQMVAEKVKDEDKYDVIGILVKSWNKRYRR
jgi:hypothetical protein